jgi:hypothetical protein
MVIKLTYEIYLLSAEIIKRISYILSQTEILQTNNISEWNFKQSNCNDHGYLPPL